MTQERLKLTCPFCGKQIQCSCGLCRSIVVDHNPVITGITNHLKDHYPMISVHGAYHNYSPEEFNEYVITRLMALEFTDET